MRAYINCEHMGVLKRWYLREHYTLGDYIRHCQAAASALVHADESNHITGSNRRLKQPRRL